MSSLSLANPESAKTAIAVLREHLDFELTEVDDQGRYVLDFAAMSDVIEAVDEIEEALDEDEAEGGE
ncbi:hypothetical protein OIU35_24475 [Boseaceae bacterium BT-24-1]|nr:hypothetical protein [Boseaceae bacterium BT-24-1]